MDQVASRSASIPQGGPAPCLPRTQEISWGPLSRYRHSAPTRGPWQWLGKSSPRDKLRYVCPCPAHVITCLLKGNGNQDTSGDRNLLPGASKEPLKRENTCKAFSLLNNGPQLLLLLTSRVRPLTNHQDVAGSSFAHEACHDVASNYLSSYT